MNQASRLPFILVAVLLVLAAVADGEPMRDEDVVRMFVSGVTANELIEMIRASETDFDLSDEMIGEMRIAGLPEPVIRAMIDRQRERDGDAAPAGGDAGNGAVSEEPATARVVLRTSVRLPATGNERETPFLRLPGEASPGLARALELGTTEEEVAVTGGAFFVSCVTAEHVPDHWRNKSPLGRDFIRTQRHRMLAFHPGVEAIEEPSEAPTKPQEPPEKAGKRKRQRKLAEGRRTERRARWKLLLPERLELEVEPGVRHDLLVGVAAEIGGRYYMIAAAEVEELLLETGDQAGFVVTVAPQERIGFNMELSLGRDAEDSNPG